MRSGSAVVEAMRAVFVSVVAWFGAVTTMVIVVVEPAAHGRAGAGDRDVGVVRCTSSHRSTV